MWLKQLLVQNAPGFEHGDGPALKELSSGINIVTGPNGSGKSTLCRSMRTALWPELHNQENWKQFTSSWQTSSNTIHLNFLGDQSDASSARESLRLPASNLASCYTIELADLLLEGNESDTFLAREVTRLLSGGYDLPALSHLNRYKFAPNRSRALLKKIRDAEIEYKSSRAEYERIAEEVDRLPTLEDELSELNGHQTSIDYIELRLKLAQLQDELSVLNDRKSSLSNEVFKLQGNELSEYDSFETSITDLRGRISDSKEELLKLSRSIEKYPFPSLEFRQELIALKGQVESLKELEHELSSLSKTKNKLSSELSAIASNYTHINFEELAKLQIEDIDTWAKVFSQRTKLLAARDSLQERKYALLKEARSLQIPNPANDPSHLLSLYRQWIGVQAEVSSLPKSRFLIWTIFGLAIVASLLAALFFQLGFHNFAYLPVPLFSIYLLSLRHHLANKRSKREAITSLNSLITQAENFSEKAALQNLTRETALIRIRELEEELFKSKSYLKLQAILSDTERAIEDIEIKIDTARVDTTSLNTALKGPLTSDFTLGSLCEPFRAYLKNLLELEGVNKEIDRVSSDLEESLKSLNLFFEALKFHPIQSATSANSALTLLEQDFSTFSDQSMQRDSLEEKLAKLEEDLKKTHTTQLEFFEQFALKSTDKRLELQELLADHRNLEELEKHIFSTSQSLALISKELTGFPDGITTTFANLDTVDLKQQIESLRQKLSSRDVVLQEISRIKEKQRSLKNTYALEEKLRTINELHEELGAERDKALRAAVAHFYLQSLSAQQQDHNLPSVFLKAAELFSRFTKGRYNLLPPESNGNSQLMRAQDTSSGKALTLSDLSTGTRTQLLIAARAAFAISTESTETLPLVFDEALSSSDPIRFRSVAECLIDLARDGRQIIYFSCQPSDAALWKQIAEEHSYNNLRSIKLGLHSQQSLQFEDSLFSAHEQIEAPQPPLDSESYTDYSKRIGLPALPQTPIADSVHVAYLLEDKHVLHQLLSSSITTVGQYRRVSQLDPGSIPLSSDQKKVIQQKIEILRTAMRAIQIGRGKPLSAGELAKLCNTKQLESIVTKAEELKWNANLLLEAIDPDGGKELKGLRKTTFTQISEALHSHGFVSDSEPLREDEARALVFSQLRSQHKNGSFNPNLVDTVFHSVWDFYQPLRDKQ